MGCCVSTSNTSSSAPTPKKIPKHKTLKPAAKSKTEESRAPPPSLEELETVKEVLSETPKPIKTLNPEEYLKTRETNKKVLPVELPSTFLDKKIKDEKILLHQEEIFEQEGSEVCSFSESVSTTTFNNERSMDDEDDEDDDGHEVKQRLKRSPAPKLPARYRPELGSRQDRVVGKSPTRRSDMSPAKRNNVGAGGGGGQVRLVQSKESGSGQPGRRVGLRPDPHRRDPGESSGRRSRSPATNRSAMGRSPSAKRTTRSPGRARNDPTESGGNGSNMRVERGADANKRAIIDSSTNESLENPLVSLECFIFL